MAKPGRKKGSIPWNKGVKGYILWPNGREFSDIHRKNISISNKGRKVWNEGKPHLKIRGKNNPNWKGGITSKEQTLRSRIEFRLWSKKVFLRCGRICKKCGSINNLVAHHIKSFREYEFLRYDPKNGIVVCRSCHIKIHHHVLNYNI